MIQHAFVVSSGNLIETPKSCGTIRRSLVKVPNDATFCCGSGQAVEERLTFQFHIF
jgi:hypothetical protein